MTKAPLIVTVFLVVLTISPATVGGHLGETVVCYRLTQPVTIDGKWTSETEWNDAGETQFLVGDGDGVGYFRVKHDGTSLFVLAESLIDTAVEYNSTIGFGDYMGVFLDTLHNDGSSPATDDYRFVAGWVNASYTQIVTRKGTGAGWGQTGPVEGVQAKIGLDAGNSPHAPYPHTVGEFMIPLSIVWTRTFGFFIRFGDSSEVLTMHFYWPGPTLADQSIDPSTWGNVSIDAPILSDLANFAARPTNSTLLAIGDLTNNPHGSKPSGVNYQIGRDMTPLGYVRGMLNNTQPSIFDTNAAVNATTGRPSGDWDLIFSIGGPGINSVSYYYETTSVLVDKAPVRFSLNATHYVWTNRTDDEVLAVLRSSCNVPPGTTDVFVIQVLRDADGRLVALMYGTHYTGTWAAAEYFKFHVYPTIASWTDSYYIVQWTDAASGTSANFLPDSGDAFTILAQGQ